MTQASATPKLSKICLIAFVVAVGFFFNELHHHGAFDLAFLTAGALGCLYLLMLAGEHFAEQHRYHSLTSHLVEIRQATQSTTLQRQPRVGDRRHGIGQPWPRRLERRKATAPLAAAG